MSKIMMSIALAVLVVTTGTGHRISAQAPTAVPAPPGAAGNDTVAQLLAEVRGLRSELAEAARVSVRSQLLTARLQLQEQRLMHLDQQRSAVSAKRTDAERIRTMFATQLKGLEDDKARSDPNIAAIQDAMAGTQSQLKAILAAEASFRAEEDALLNAIGAEQARWADFNNRLDELERSLPVRAGAR